MKPSATAKTLLKPHWLSAVTVQGIGVAVSLLLWIAEWLAAKELSPLIASFFGTAALSGPLAAAVILTIALLLDLLLASPLRVGKAAFYRTLGEGGNAFAKQLGRYYRSGRYGKSVRWRLALWTRRALFGVPCTLPAVLLFALANYTFQRGMTAPDEQLTYLLLLIASVFFLLVGLTVLQLLMLRYMPAQYLLEECGSVREAIRLSKRLTKGKTGETAALYLQFACWLPACLLGVPYFYAAPLFHLTRSQWVAQQKKVCYTI